MYYIYIYVYCIYNIYIYIYICLYISKCLPTFNVLRKKYVEKKHMIYLKAQIFLFFLEALSM